MTLVLIALGLLLAGFPLPQPNVDPAIKVLVERFFATQEAEDLEGYLALWSRTAQKPPVSQLRFVFTSGDDKFTNLEIEHVTVADREARVRVSISRLRTATDNPNPDGTPRVFDTRVRLALALVKEDGAWKLVREGAPADELAASLIAETDAARRAEMLAAESDVVNIRLIESMARQADLLARGTLYKPAQAIYERAVEVARAIPDRVAEGRMLQNVANSLYFQRDFAGALAHYSQRLALERETANDDGIATALVGIGTIRYSIAEYSAALTTYREALAIQERLDDEPLIATTVLSIGNVLYLQGDYDGAIADYRRAEALRRKHHDPSGAATALEGLARTYLAQGDLSAALLAFSGVLDEGRKQRNATRQGTALLSIGDIHFRLGNLDVARTTFEQGRKQFESIKDLANAGRVWQGTAVTELVAARFAVAEAAYAKSHAACSAAQPEPDDECATRALVGLAFSQAAQQRFDDAIGSYRKGIAAFGRLKLVEAAARAQVGLAEALSGKKDFAAALIEAGHARQTGTSLAKDDLLWRAFVAQARAQRNLKRPADALGSAGQALAAVRRMAAQSLQRSGEAVPRDTTGAFLTAAILQAEAGDPKAAFDTIEQMRAHALRTALAAHERDIASGMSGEERAEERTFDGEVRSLFARIDRSKSLPSPDLERIAKLEADLRLLTERRDAARQRLFTKLPHLRVWRALAPPATSDEVGSLLKADAELLVEFVVDDHDLLIVTAQRTGGALILASHVVPVERHALAERVARAVDPAALSDVESWRRASADLFKLVPPAVGAQLAAASSVTIMPDEVLWRVPFEAMPVDARYLADKTRVRYASSATALLRAPEPAQTSSLRLAIAAAPQLPPSVVTAINTTAPAWTLRPDAAGEAEAARITTLFGETPVTVIAGPAATEKAVRAAAAGATVLHVAAPFRINAASPLFSAFLLVPGEVPEGGMRSAGDDGLFEVREVPTAALTTQTVLFSDPAAMDMRDAAASVPAVQWVWRAGGVETLILRRWGGDAAAVNDLLAGFYQHARDGRPAAAAMTAATAAARNAPGLQPPVVWAGWLVLSGR